MCFKPNTQALRLENVSLAVLRHLGIRVLFLDADNTVTTWNNPHVGAEVKDWIAQAKAMGFAVLIASNNSAQRLEPLRQALEINCVEKANKPLPFRLRSVAKQLQVKPNQCAMIGDQLLTDMLAGNLAGMHTVLLRPIDLTAEFKGTKINRRIEKVLKKWLKLSV